MSAPLLPPTPPLPKPAMTSDTHRLLAPCLTASAVVLAGLLASQIGRRAALPEARAEILNQQEGFTLMSASIGSDEEGLFVLDNTSGVLLVYMLSNDNERMELNGAVPVERLFADGSVTEPGVDEDDPEERRVRPPIRAGTRE